MPDQAELVSVREANARYHDGYERRLAAEIVAMLPDDRDEAVRVLRAVDAILDLPVGEPKGESVPRSADA